MTRWPCLIGWHSWSPDSAVVTSADCCAVCGRYRDPVAERMLKVERDTWATLEPSTWANFGAKVSAVHEALAHTREGN